MSEVEARALRLFAQLLPIAFTFRVRANHESALLLCLLLALYGLERARTGRPSARPWSLASSVSCWSRVCWW